MAFKGTRNSTVNLSSPESLLHDLRQKKIKGPFSHQADMWRDYVKNSLEEKDVALQLPTGSGKTLVGLIIGEWRRRKFQERIIYICPTNQLVNQVTTQANTLYGLNVTSFTGSSQYYASNDKINYQSGETMAISSYSALFNVNPFFSDPQIIIVDDAHSSENYISKFWSLSIKKSEYKVLFTVISSLLKGIISNSDFQKLTGLVDSILDISWVGKLATPNYFNIHPDMVSILDEHCNGTDLFYPWKLIRDHLDATNLFYSMNEILIRPLIPPTETHFPFANAKQRIYMSATLGEGGDLERLTGRKNIKRLEIPPGWDKQGIGRRLFFFPSRSLDKDSVNKLSLELFKINERSLILVPDDNSASKMTEIIKQDLGFQTFSAREIEESKENFISNKHAIAIMSNRYDGIDFPEEECRMLYVEGLPRATNLQEKFFIQKMGATILLNDRILTRIVQAFGRCTRSATDYSIVEVIGDELIKFLMNIERRKYLHPELQAELQFGLNESSDIILEDFLENAKIFLEQNDGWIRADSEIISIRDNCVRVQLPCIDELKKSVKSEVNYQYNLWKGDYVSAFENCREILGILNNNELRGYRALWNYFAGSAAWLATKNNQVDLSTQSKEYFAQALKNVAEIKWLSNLITLTDKNEKDYREVEVNGILIENLENSIQSLGLVNNRNYDKEEKLILEGFELNDSKKFENAQVHLGQFLGFEAGNEETSGAPDPWWKLADNLCFVFEDHSEANPTSTLSVKKARQVSSHPLWIKTNFNMSKDSLIIPILITPVIKIDEVAFPILHDVFVWNLNDYKQWVKNSLATIRNLRKIFDIGDLFWRKTALDTLCMNNITPHELINLLKKMDYKSNMELIKK